MAKSKNENGNVDHNTKETPEILRFIKKDFRRTSLDHYAEDFCRAHEIAARDVAEGRLPVATWNSMRGGYSNILRAIDAQMRARKMGVTPANKKMLNP